MLGLGLVKDIDLGLRDPYMGRTRFIANSWLRSVETYGMDPSRPKLAHLVTEPEPR